MVGDRQRGTVRKKKRRERWRGPDNLIGKLPIKPEGQMPLPKTSRGKMPEKSKKKKKKGRAKRG